MRKAAYCTDAGDYYRQLRAQRRHLRPPFDGTYIDAAVRALGFLRHRGYMLAAFGPITRLTRLLSALRAPFSLAARFR